MHRVESKRTSFDQEPPWKRENVKTWKLTVYFKEHNPYTWRIEPNLHIRWWKLFLYAMNSTALVQQILKSDALGNSLGPATCSTIREKLTVIYLVMKSPSLFDTRRLITRFTVSGRHLKPNESNPTLPTHLRFIPNLSSLPRPWFPSCIFPSVFIQI